MFKRERRSFVRRRSILASSCLMAVALGAGWMAQAQGRSADAAAATYEVTITNVMRGEILSPVTIYTHAEETEPLFILGSPASPELAAVAEDADASALVASLEADESVGDIATLSGAEGPLMPGETASMRVTAVPGHSLLSLASMLVTTNDGFIGVAGLELSQQGSTTQMVVAYDAGSEANTELCAHIPGPPCGNAGVRETTGAEQFVHVHAGIHGVGDLEPSNLDWRNPVARIEVRRVQ